MKVALSKCASEARVADRHTVLFAAAIEFDSTSIPCTIRNISETGAGTGLCRSVVVL